MSRTRTLAGAALLLWCACARDVAELGVCFTEDLAFAHLPHGTLVVTPDGQRIRTQNVAVLMDYNAWYRLQARIAIFGQALAEMEERLREQPPPLPPGGGAF